MILLNAAESRELDRISMEKYGIASYSLMTRAGEAVASELVERAGKHSVASYHGFGLSLQQAGLQHCGHAAQA